MLNERHAERCDELLQLLCHRQRRDALQFLNEQPNNAATTDELLDSLHGGASLSVEMHHVHLPKLHASGLIEWDPRSETIRYYPDALCEELLNTLDGHNGRPANA